MYLTIDWHEDNGRKWGPFLELTPETPDELLSVRKVVRSAPRVAIGDGFSLGAVRLALKTK